MSHVKAKMHQIRFLVSVRLSLCPSVRLCLRWSLTHSMCLHFLQVVSNIFKIAAKTAQICCKYNTFNNGGISLQIR